MIKVEFDKVHLEGNISLLATEVEEVLRSFRHSLEEKCGKDGAMDFLIDIVTNSFLENEERIKKAMHDLKNSMPSETNVIDELFNTIRDFINQKESKNDR